MVRLQYQPQGSGVKDSTTAVLRPSSNEHATAVKLHLPRGHVLHVPSASVRRSVARESGQRVLQELQRADVVDRPAGLRGKDQIKQ